MTLETLLHNMLLGTELPVNFLIRLSSACSGRENQTETQAMQSY